MRACVLKTVTIVIIGWGIINSCFCQDIMITGKATFSSGLPVTTGSVFIQDLENSTMYIGGYPSPNILSTNSRAVAISGGTFRFTLDAIKPHILFFSTPGKKMTSILFPAGKSRQVELNAVFADTSDKQQYTFITTNEPGLIDWIKVYAMSSLIDSSDVKKQMDSSVSYRLKNGTQEGFFYDLSGYYHSMLDIYQKTDDRSLKNFVLLNLSFLCVGNKYPVEEKYLLEAVRNTAPSDPIWLFGNGMFQRGVYFGLGTFTKNKTVLLPLLEELYKQSAYESQKPGLLYSLMYYAKSSDIPEAVMYYSELLNKYPDSRQAAAAKKNYPVTKKITVGEPLPAFSVDNLDKKGESITNTSLIGKIYLIDFWATWCGPCVQELPHIEKLYEKYKNQGLEILTISMDAETKTIAEFRNKRYKLLWKNGHAGNSDKKLMDDFELHAIPRLILVDAKGVVFAEKGVELNNENLESTIVRLLERK